MLEKTISLSKKIDQRGQMDLKLTDPMIETSRRLEDGRGILGISLFLEYNPPINFLFPKIMLFYLYSYPRTCNFPLSPLREAPVQFLSTS